jgi:hypothetical protein
MRNVRESNQGGVMPYYLFAGATGTRIAVTDDKRGSRLPPHPAGQWVFKKELNLDRRDDGTRIALTEAEIAEAVKRDGYLFWPPLKKGETL